MKTPLFQCFALLCALPLSAAEKAPLAAEKKEDRLVITRGGKPLADFVFKDPKILRPYFANVKTPAGVQVTRAHPPVEGKDATDHAEMHPGIWLAFGDVSGQDFWRNRAAIRHERFTREPAVADGALTFTTLSKMVPAEGAVMAEMTSTVSIVPEWEGWFLLWEAAFTPLEDGFYFGDQEEMGLGVRMATPLTEKQGGVILSSTGKKSAKETWGQTADWCDYSGRVDGKECGLQFLASPDNFRQSWFHNRDYGLMVANAFGKQAFTKSGKPDRLSVEKNKTLRLRYGVAVHDAFVSYVEPREEVMWRRYQGLSRRAEKLEEVRRLIAALRGGADMPPSAGALEAWELSLSTYGDEITLETAISLYAETCRKLKAIHGTELQTRAEETPRERPGIYTAVPIKDRDGKVQSCLMVSVTQGKDSTGYHFAHRNGPWEPDERLKALPSWEMPKDYFGKAAD